ncbi:hypothetical protein [Lyngbya confervoides]|uniref:MacB-like periplasmic core domain-containing protein n=1 Tax=Lyngbya confervoides BDU141951 TaxID=1574623 RepID=A0ABD4T8M2_9CYAN|nr:hypothetical protein [Lyngbya confervoides]MCM1985098.1 hypothetical protein [Lyngbya confervoides BDU141951]
MLKRLMSKPSSTDKTHEEIPEVVGIDDSTAQFSLDDFIEAEAEVDLTVSDQKTVKKRMDFLTLFVIGAALLGGTNLLLTLLNMVMIAQVAGKPAPTLVELQGGKSITVAAIGSKERTTEAIQTFVSESLVELFDWRGMIQSPDSRDSAPIPDPGVEIGGGQRVTYATWAASYRFEDSWQPELLKAIATMTPQSLFNQSDRRTQGLLVVREMGQPTKTNEGQWQIDVVANLILFENGDNVGRAIPFNKKVTVAAVDPPAFSDDPSELQTVIYNARKAGMIIQFMEDLKA